MQLQAPQSPSLHVPGPSRASSSASKPPQQSTIRPAEGSTILQPQISLEVAEVQQMGASFGAKLRPESAQKIQV